MTDANDDKLEGRLHGDQIEPEAREGLGMRALYMILI